MEKEDFPMSEIRTIKDINIGHTEAIVTKLGGLDNYILALRHDYELIVRPKTPTYFDKKGRGIPDVLQSSFCNPDVSFSLPTETIASNGLLFAGYDRASKYLMGYLGRGMMSFDDYQSQVTNLFETLRANESTNNILNGACFPVVFPEMVITDLGEMIESLIGGVGDSYREQYPKRTFTNHQKGELVGNVVSIDKGHDKFLASLSLSSKAALWFPNAMQGFSVLAQREFIKLLDPANWSLDGVIGPIFGITMYPEKLAYSYNTPGYDCSALQYKSAGQSLYLKAFDGYLGLDVKVYLGFANGSCSGGLLFRIG